METIADRIRYRRIELGLTQEELAKALGYKHKSSIGKIESGDQLLTQRKIVDISKALHTTPEWILGWNGDNSSVSIDIDQLVKGYKELSINRKHMLMNFLTMLLQEEHS